MDGPSIELDLPDDNFLSITLKKKVSPEVFDDVIEKVFALTPYAFVEAEKLARTAGSDKAVDNDLVCVQQR